VTSTSLENAVCEKAESTRDTSSTRRYLEALELAPGLKKLLGGAKLVSHLGTTDDSPTLVHTASDYSYSADKYAGGGWRVIGDAGGR